MKKLSVRFAVLAVCAAALSAYFITSAAVSLAAEPEACELVFKPAGGGKYIYCNNAESVFADAMADGDSPAYIMNNEALGPDRYYLYISHFNFVNFGSGEGGFDTELDVRITAREDSALVIERTGFDTPYPYFYKSGSVFVRDEHEWENLQACADMRGDIYHIDGNYVYKNENADDTGSGSFALKAGETVWLSEYIKNYRAVAYRKPVHMQALIDVLSGSVDMNVCMLKSNGTPGDRSGFNSEPAFGEYRRDRTQKGIADTLPLVTAELEYTIDDSTAAGTALPVTVRNQYVPDGNTVTTWATHLNPQDDIWSKTITAENDVLTYKYKDDSKLSFYGADVPESERDNVWIFDPFHSDTREYVPQSGVSQTQYSPNYLLSPEKDNQGYACSIGNYGVWTTYHFTVTNNGTRDRRLEYAPTTPSNILVYSDTEPFDVFEMTDKKTYCKGMNETGVEDIMASELLPAGKTTDVYISVNLPVNTYGGVMNTFRIADTDNFHPTEAEPFETVPGNDYPLLSELDSPGESTLKALGGNLSNYELIGDPESGYIARPCAWDARPYWCYNIWDFTEVIYALDKNYNIIGTYKFPSPPTEGGFDGEKHYIKTVQHGIYESSDGGVSWSKSARTAIPDRAVVSLAGYTPAEIMLDGAENTVLPDSVSDALGKYISRLELRLDSSDAEGGTAELTLERDGVKLILDGGVWRARRKTYTPLNFTGADFNEKLRSIVSLCESGCSDWSRGYMAEALLENVIGSYFWAEDPDAPITRGDFASLAMNVLTAMDMAPAYTGDSGFSDDSTLFARALSQAGIIMGYPDGTFRPDASISRQEAAAILSRAAQYAGIKPDGEPEAFTDSGSISYWAAGSVEDVSRMGIMLGVPDGGGFAFDPQGSYTREQSVATMMRLYELQSGVKKYEV